MTALAVPPQTPAMLMRLLMCLSFQAWDCLVRKYSVMMEPMLWLTRRTGVFPFSTLHPLNLVTSQRGISRSSLESKNLT